MPNPGHLGSIILLVRSCLSYKFDTAWPFSFLYSHPTFLSPTFPCTLGTYCFGGHPFPCTSKLVLPMVMCQALHSLYTSRLSPSASALPTPSHTFPPVPLSLLLFLPLHTSFISTPSLLPIALLRDIFYSCGYFLHTHHTFSFPSSLHATLLPSLAALLCFGSPIGYA